MRYQYKVFLFLLLMWSCKEDDSGNGNPNDFDNELEFTETFGGTKNEEARSIILTQDGGYAIIGSTSSKNGDVQDKDDESYDYWVLKFNANDELEWSKTFGGTSNDHGYDLVQTADQGFVILGYSQSNDGDVGMNNGLSDAWVAKLDADGNLLWKNTFGFVGGDTGFIITASTDGGFLLTGLLDAFASGGEGIMQHPGGNYWSIKINANGVKEWSQHYGGFFTDTPYGAVQTEDGGYIIVGSSDSYESELFHNLGTYDFWIIKISSTGELVWTKNYGGERIDEARAITQTGDGNYLIVGDTRSSDQFVSENKGSADLWMIKINPNGELIWEKSYGGSDFDVARSVLLTSDNGFLISGSTRSNNGDVTENKGGNDAWILKTDPNGELLWQKSVGGSQFDFAYDAIQKLDNTIIAVGVTESNNGDITENKGGSDLFMIKLK
jgi:hypothetical protein